MATGRYKEEIRGNSKSRFTNHKETSQNSTHSINNSGPSRFRRKDRALRARSRGRFGWPVLGALRKATHPLAAASAPCKAQSEGSGLRPDARPWLWEARAAEAGAREAGLLPLRCFWSKDFRGDISLVDN